MSPQSIDLVAVAVVSYQRPRSIPPPDMRSSTASLLDRVRDSVPRGVERQRVADAVPTRPLAGIHRRCVMRWEGPGTGSA